MLTVPAVTAYDTDAELMATVLRVYKQHCRYLRSAVVRINDDSVSAGCAFVIPESCYIDDTGHFNSVEFNICYNQMVYYLIAKSIKEGLLDAFADWTLEAFWPRQLPDFFIASLASTFRSPMRGRRFNGEITVVRARRRRPVPDRPPLIWLETTCRYWEDSGGKCDGEIRIAVRDSSGDRAKER